MLEQHYENLHKKMQEDKNQYKVPMKFMIDYLKEKKAPKEKDSTISAAQEERLRKVFAHYDHDQSDSLEAREFKNAFTDAGLMVMDHEVDKVREVARRAPKSV